jgi:hypothetical protein
MNKEAFTLIEVHKNDVMVGDIILHDGRDRTVCRKDITVSSFMGVCLFGDSYHSGHKPVQKYIYNNPLT